MKDFNDIEKMRKAAFVEQLKAQDLALLGGPRRHQRDRDYAEGVEAGLLWAMDFAGNPFPR